jgi:RNA polymerase sigma factor (sigma-70 family)
MPAVHFVDCFDLDQRAPSTRVSTVNSFSGVGNDPSMGETRSDAELIGRASRKPELFGVVFDRHFATIHRYLERRVGRDGADELAGEVFRIAFEQRRRFRPVHESALPWLYGLATNLLLKRWRGDARAARALARLQAASLNGDGELEAAEDRLSMAQTRTQLLEALAGLEPGDRDVVVLVAWEELTYEEVASALDIPLGTVRSRLNRARRAFRELFADSGDEPVTLIGKPHERIRDEG